MDKKYSVNFSPEKADEFVRLLTANYQKIYSYIVTLVPHRADADDITQEVTSVMLQLFDTFKPGTSFSAWGKKIAFYEILQLRRKQRISPLSFQDEKTLQAIEHYVSPKSDLLDQRLDALQECIGKLDDKGQKLICVRYREGTTVHEAAQELGINVSTLYRMLERIHHILMRCIRRTAME